MKINWNKFVKCSKCGSVFICEVEDLLIFFNAELEKTKRFVVCPECWEHIKVEVEIDEIR